MTTGRTRREFIAFLTGLVERSEHAREIHLVLDNLSARKTRDVEQFPIAYPKVRFHFTPTYSSWLNQVELWFAKIQRDVISPGVFTSVADLGNKLRKYIRAHSKSGKPFRCTLGWSPGVRQTVEILLTVRCKFIVSDAGTVLGWARR